MMVLIIPCGAQPVLSEAYSGSAVNQTVKLAQTLRRKCLCLRTLNTLRDIVPNFREKISLSEDIEYPDQNLPFASFCKVPFAFPRPNLAEARSCV